MPLLAGLGAARSADGKALLGEIYTPSQLREHARELAASHKLASEGDRPRPVLEEFAGAVEDLTAAYRIIAAAAQSGQDIVPAEEWLYDNFHVVEEQIREVREDLPRGYYAELPRLAEGDDAGYPRVYVLALDFIRHTDARLDRENLSGFVQAYQEVHALSIGELWAVPIMLRLGLVENVRRLANQEIHNRATRERADRWADRLIARARQRQAETVVAVAELATSGEELSPVFLVRLIKRLRDEDLPMSAAVAWIDELLAEDGRTAAELTRSQHHHRAVEQVSVGNSISSMRQIGALNWTDFFEQVSLVEQLLREDPAEAYAEMDVASRDYYRRQVERLAERGRVDEVGVVREVLARAAAASVAAVPDHGVTHVGYYLIDTGRSGLEAAIGYRPTTGERVRRLIRARPTLTYLGTLGLLTGVATLVLLGHARADGAGGLAIFAIALLLVLVGSEVAISLVNWVTNADLEPSLLPTMRFEHGIPETCRTAVVVPTILTSTEAIEKLLAELEVRYLANQDRHVHFALLTDFPDAPAEEQPGDAALLEQATHGIEALNERHGAGQSDRFYLFHRRRLWSPGQGVWMGWERKRGKLEEFNRLLRGGRDTSFAVSVGDLSALRGTRYVITLDTDTQLPRDVAKRLVGTIAHPLQQAHVDPMLGRVTRGYGIVQPRVSTTLASAGRSFFARVFTGNTGIDPYTTAISDVYQDLFDEGSYYGKAIYDVDAFSAALHGRVPPNWLLSHDLFEGLFARAALASNIELLDDFPAHYSVYAGRQHRWVRGDWQQAPWLLPRVPNADGKWVPNRLPIIARWKLFDNLRRSLLPPAILALLVAGWTVLPGSPLVWTAAALLAVATPVFAHLTTAIVRPDLPTWSSGFWASWGGLRPKVLQVGLTIALLPDQALLMVDAVARTLYRLFVSRRDLLQWETATEAERRVVQGPGGLWTRMWPASALAVVILVLVAAVRPWSLPLALPFLLVWGVSPAIAHRISVPTPPRERTVPAEAVPLLRRTARKTWRFFETFVTADDNWLPPDNYQEDPKDVLARRTSPTNIGIYLLSAVAARDFGYLGLGELAERLERTLSTVEKLSKHRGHLFNWYDTASLDVLQPAYISTVDSGNLAGHLLALKQACAEFVDAKPADERLLAAIEDVLGLMREVDAATGAPGIGPAVDSLADAVGQARRSSPTDLMEWAALLEVLCQGLQDVEVRVRALVQESRAGRSEDLTFWAERLGGLIRVRAAELRSLIGPGADGTAPPLHGGGFGVPSLAALAAVSPEARVLVERFTAAGRRAEALVERMDFRLVYDNGRELFSIGYDVSRGQRDDAFYDLLASEARLGSLVAIAKGDVPQSHWFRLGRTRVPAAGSYPLLSWSGTMFEYLMPLLVMRSYERTLLDETYGPVVDRQIEYAASRGVPWGISESAYNTLDLALNYQYQAFGVPGLGLKPGLAENLVVSPYSTLLALQVRPGAACENLRRLVDAGLEGRYGFFEAIDYTQRRVPPGRKSVVVRAFMAHHQGMGLLALDNVLHSDPLPRRFHLNPIIRATELLLQERVPDLVRVVAPVVEDGHAAPAAGPESDVGHAQRVVRLSDPQPTAHLLSNGAYSLMLTSTGSGYSAYRDRMLTRWRADATLDDRGTFIYVRDLDSGHVWSSGYGPTRTEPDDYQAFLLPEGVRYARRDGTIDTVTELAVSPESNAEVRRVTLTNRGGTPRRIELTSYAEVVLAPAAADTAHPSFSSLFVETEWLDERGALLCSRRPRSGDEARPWLVHVTAVQSGERAVSAPEYETSRLRFIGRGRDSGAPVALVDSGPLSATRGAVLDPIVSLRRAVMLAPGGRAEVTFSMAAAESRDEALALADRFADPHTVSRTFELAWTDARVELRHLNLSAERLLHFQQLVRALLYGDGGLRAPSDILARGASGQPALWAYGISGDLPIVLVRVDDPTSLGLVEELLLAHEFWRLNQLTVDLVLLNEDPGGYLQPLQEQLLALVTASAAHGHLDQHGGVFVRRADLMPDDDRLVLQSVARVVLQTSQGPLARQLARRERNNGRPIKDEQVQRTSAVLPPVELTRRATVPDGPTVDGAGRVPPRTTSHATQTPPDLRFFNGRGGFTPDGREYVILLGAGEWTPTPWINVLANERFGALVTESGCGYSWYGNSQTNRLTPWSNDPVSDPSGDAIYLRDEEDGVVWSPTPLPSRDGEPYQVRHGQGYTVYEHASAGVDQELTVFVAPDEPVKIQRLRLRNLSGRPRQLSATSYVEWVLGTTRDRTSPYVITEYAPAIGTILARCPYADPDGRVAFVAADAPLAAITADRTEFLGRAGSRAAPAGLGRVELSGASGPGLDPCAAIQVRVELGPNEEREIVFVLGQADGREQAIALARRYADRAEADQSLETAIAGWDELLGTIQVETPDESLNLLLNRWLLYQTLGCRVWARSAFYQSGGAYGFRDQLQDVMALLYAAPARARSQILRSAARQFPEGDVQHWWHPDTGQGVRTRCSDDLLWLPFVVARYLAVTGDEAILDEVVPFIEMRPLAPDEHEVFDLPAVSAELASLYEHCLRALERGQTRGPRGLPLIGTGDWNDGMNRVGHEGRGESVWLGWFLARTLQDFAPICESRGDPERAAAFRSEAHRLGATIDEQAWDGAWYRRAYFDDGTPLGSTANDDCQIDAIAQSWSVIAGVGDPLRARTAMQSAYDHLVRADPGLILLLQPPFWKGGLDPGYIKGYLPGVRENGGQYTHGALWMVQAAALLGDGDRAVELLRLINPINHALTPAEVERYRVEPYVVAADVYASPQHLGRGGWTWYTGSAGWMYRVALETILGFTLRGDRFSLDPTVPRSWHAFSLTYRRGATCYEVSVENPNAVNRGVERVELDGVGLTDGQVPISDDGGVHCVRVILG